MTKVHMSDYYAYILNKIIPQTRRFSPIMTFLIIAMDHRSIKVFSTGIANCRMPKKLVLMAITPTEKRQINPYGNYSRKH
jgi:hypothetical protein